MKHHLVLDTCKDSCSIRTHFYTTRRKAKMYVRRLVHAIEPEGTKDGFGSAHTLRDVYEMNCSIRNELEVVEDEL